MLNPARVLTVNTVESSAAAAGTIPELTMHAPVPATMPHGPAMDRAAWIRGGVVVLLLVALYLRIGIKLVKDWIEFPDYSHGLLIPFFVAFLIWDQRERLKSSPRDPSWWGIPLMMLGSFELLVGVFGADLFLARTSLILVLCGLILALFGRPMLSRTKFILFVLFLSIPLPTLILNHITFPLQLLASEVASSLLPLFGVPVLREGNVMSLPAMQLEVAEACSGIRSLMSLFTVAVIFGYFVERTTSRRTVLVLAAVPIAVAANVARIVGTGLCVQYWDPVKAMGFFHEFSGWLMFLVSLSCLYLVHITMRRLRPLRGEA